MWSAVSKLHNFAHSVLMRRPRMMAPVNAKPGVAILNRGGCDIQTTYRQHTTMNVRTIEVIKYYSKIS